MKTPLTIIKADRSDIIKVTSLLAFFFLQIFNTSSAQKEVATKSNAPINSSLKSRSSLTQAAHRAPDEKIKNQDTIGKAQSASTGMSPSTNTTTEKKK